MSSKSHWEKIYKEKSPHEVSWTQEIPFTSIHFFSDFKIQKDNPIIDVGGGESKFVDYLIDNGYENISVLDISENAINRAKDRIGFRSKFINWIVCDINDFEPEKNYAVWHDRALFHFLTSQTEIDRYVKKVKLNAKNFIIGTFSTLGPKKCIYHTVLGLKSPRIHENDNHLRRKRPLYCKTSALGSQLATYGAKLFV